MENVAEYAKLLEILSTRFDGAEFGKKVTQKMFYFFCRKGMPLNLRYGIHYYGPYSQKLDTILHVLESYDYININTAGRTHVISLGSHKVDDTALDINQTRIAEQVNSEFAHKSPYELEALATMDYVANSILPKGSSDKKIIEKFTEIKGNKFTPEMIQTTIQELRALQYIA